MNRDDLVQMTLVIRAIEDEGGKIREDILMEKLSKTGSFQRMNCGNQVVLPEAEIILQCLLLSNRIRIEAEKTIGNFWIPMSVGKEICLIK